MLNSVLVNVLETKWPVDIHTVMMIPLSFEVVLDLSICCTLLILIEVLIIKKIVVLKKSFFCNNFLLLS